MQLRPAIEILERIVGAVVGAPADDALQVAARVEVLLEELPRGRDVLGEKLPFERGPLRRIHPSFDADGHVGRPRCHRERRAATNGSQRAERQVCLHVRLAAAWYPIERALSGSGSIEVQADDAPRLSVAETDARS